MRPRPSPLATAQRVAERPAEAGGTRRDTDRAEGRSAGNGTTYKEGFTGKAIAVVVSKPQRKKGSSQAKSNRLANWKNKPE